jgi:hypothetical protein
MTILVEPSKEVTVDLNQGVESDPVTPVVEPAADIAVEAGFVMPDKFKDKTLEQVAQSYVELEKYQGNLNNQLGDYRTMTDRFLSIEEKRVADLEQAGVEKYEIDATDLLANPEKVLEEYFEHRKGNDPQYTELQSRLDRIEGQVGNSTLNDRHSDAEAVAGSPEFYAWVQEHPYRQGLAQQAVQNKDVDQLDYLLTEFKGQNPSQPADNDSDAQQQNELQAARSVSTESTSASGNTSAASSKRFSRRKLVQLKINNPEEYSAMSDEILMAYAQKRVDD